MLISLNWLRSFVELPADVDPHALAERLTLTCAEVEGVEHINVGAVGLICARVESVTEIPGASSLRRVQLNTAAGGAVETVSAAPVIHPGDHVLYAPPGARLGRTGEIGQSQVGGQSSTGLIVSGDSVGIAAAIGEVVTLPTSSPPGETYDRELFDDWVIEIDNKAITHRPDLWGHYGFAREIAAMYGVPLGEYPVVPAAELKDDSLPSIPIEIDNPELCPRYTGLLMRGVTAQPSPLWMQLLLGHVGMRPIDALVDLTNYIMAELGQPMHAFDGDKVSRIEVGCAKAGEKFTTLDGTERTLAADALMIMRERHPVALAGVMGGLETEVSQHTRAILLESANFEAATIRRTATVLGLRTEASARFEKSLDPAYTVLAIQRFVHLARQQYPDLAIAASLSDCYPAPAAPMVIDLDPEFVRTVMGHPVTDDQMKRILRALEFTVDHRGDSMRVTVPSFRATKDVQTEVDLIEEICRYVGFGNITPSLPEVTVRCFQPNPAHTLEHATLRHWCESCGYHEIYGYIWDDVNWNRQLGYAPSDSHELRNPAGAGLQFLRQSLIPGMLAAADRNRHHFDEFHLAELGSVFLPRPVASHTSETAELDAAIEYYNAALRIDPDNAPAHNSLGIALKEMGHLDAAIEHYHAALRIDPNHTIAHNNLGIALKDMGRLDAAIEHYHAVLRIDPDHAEAHNNLGIALKDMGRLDVAIEHYHAVLRIDPDHVEAHNNLGIALKDMGRPDAAIEHYHAALRIDPNYSKAHSNLGVVLKDIGDLDSAMEHSKAALRLDPDYAGAHNTLGMALKDMGELDDGTANNTGERKRIGLLAARRSKKAEADLLAELKGAVETWALRVLGAPVWFDRADAQLPWEHPIKTASARVQGKSIGRLGVVPLPLRQRIDDHLAAWSMVWAELDLGSALEVTSPVEQLPPIPSHPQVDLDFSFLVRAAERFKDVSRKIAEFRHPLLQRVSFLDSYEGKSIGSDRRSLTFRFSLGAESRTLTDEDLATFRTAFQSHLDQLGYSLRS